jgi:hypothetical protein
VIIHTQKCKEPNCKKKFRARRNHSFCRMHHRLNHDEARPIESRELSDNKYRRSKSRRRVMRIVEDKKGKKR